MKTYLITFRSITTAQRGQDVLEEEGILCRLRRTPRWMEERGCGYALETRLAEVRKATGVLSRRQIPWRKSYRLGSDGEVEELK